MLLLNFIWCFCDSLFWRYGQICPQNDKKLPVVAILKTVATFFATKIYSLSICICWTWLGASMSLYSKDMAKYALKRLKMPCGGHFENCCEVFWKPKFAAWQYAPVELELVPLCLSVLKIWPNMWIPHVIPMGQTLTSPDLVELHSDLVVGHFNTYG